MELAASQAAELVGERAHGSQAVVVGLSEGAQVVVQMLATAPEVIDKAIVSSALLLPIPATRLLSAPWVLAWMFRLSIPPFRKNEWWIRLNMRYSAAIPEEFFPQYKANFQSMNESQFVHLMLANQRFHLPENLDKAASPTLVIAGKREYTAMKESARQLAAALPNAKAMLLDLGSGASMAKEHNWAMNAPGLFAQTVRNFIEGRALPEVLSPINPKGGQ
jgi:pimeloyl-ACP methyl ester carboxylesterase